MDNFDAAKDRESVGNRAGLLYAVMIIAAISAIAFTIAGTATIMGWMPDLASRSEPAAKGNAVPAVKPAPTRPASGCYDCGIVESIRSVQAGGAVTGLGLVAGGVAGALIGSRLGSGHGAATAAVLAAGAGAVAGNALEKATRGEARFELRVRMSDGDVRTLYQSTPPALEIGQLVRVTGQPTGASG